ncbi:hypothetical protein CANARDRAFT_6351 [[Candida] arabinofermentans NRRL YB-2248]|uniref:Uncharacterized protein n=1 Tax=[Candida] arabinofermentans NRRL YB-2248 TaxID=983967 RepID=A0A1E4T4Y0_9ASCO|nr:hypothetical protein CANARDRAFT_6351 [[Candida] arabinofermentans NRRL YB-2248]
MAAYEQRKLLEELMGPELMVHLPQDYQSSFEASSNNRNQITDPLILDSPKICKSFLVGKCPYDLFMGTKEDFGKCPKLHLEKHKDLYETSKRNNIPMPRSNFEIDYFQDLEGFVGECNRKIRIAEKRLDFTREEQQRLGDVSRDLDELDTKIGIMAQEIRLLTDKQELEKAIYQDRQLQFVIMDRDRLSKIYRGLLENINQKAQQKLQVCVSCGAYLSTLDNDKRLVDHFVGKIHMGYVEMRNSLKELKAKLESNGVNTNFAATNSRGPYPGSYR